MTNLILIFYDFFFKLQFQLWPTFRETQPRSRPFSVNIQSGLNALQQWRATNWKRVNCNFKYFVDTAPVMEKPLGMQAGLGWQGKHTNLVSKEFGSWLFLSSIFLNKEVTETKKEEDHCGSCSNCIDICPTNAIVAPYELSLIHI